jgi:hypothetical protein
MVFQGGDDGRGYRNMCKIPRGSNSKHGDWCVYVLRCIIKASVSVSERHSSWTPQMRSALGVELRSEIIPGENSDTRIKPLPLTNGHGRYIGFLTVTSERTLVVSVGVGEWPLHNT